MDISMDFNSLNSYQKAYSGENVCKLTADAVIPDTYEDIARLLSTEFSCKIISKDALFGKVTVCGELEANSLFVSENADAPASLRTVMPFSAEFSSDAIESSSTPVASIRIIASDWRELNPRKIGINADVLVALDVFNRTEMSVPIEPACNADNIFFKTDSFSMNYISSVSEKLSTLDDERALENASAILSSGTDYFSDSFELVGSRLIVKGHVHSRVVYRKNDGTAAVTEYDIPFSQLFDSDENAEISDCRLLLLPAGEYYELIDGVLNTELRIVSQLVCFERREVSGITDAYACGCGYELVKDTMQIITSRESTPVTKSAVLSYELPSDACNVMISSVRTGKISTAGNTVNVPVIVNAMYADKDNNLFSFRARENVEFEDITCNSFDATISSANCALIGGNAQFELQITLQCASAESSNMDIVSAIKLDDEIKSKNTPSLYIVRANSNDIWSISKKYGADQNRIIAINSLTDDDNICGKMLLIPM